MQDVTVTFESESAGSQVQELYDVRTQGAAQLGRVDWAAAERSFGAKSVRLANDASPGLLTAGENAGLTRNLFANGERVPVKVYKQSECFVSHP